VPESLCGTKEKYFNISVGFSTPVAVGSLLAEEAGGIIQRSLSLITGILRIRT